MVVDFLGEPGLTVPILLFAAAALYKLAGFKEQKGWQWILTGATIDLIGRLILVVDWGLIGLAGVTSPVNWLIFGVDILGFLVASVGLLKLFIDLTSE